MLYTGIGLKPIPCFMVFFPTKTFRSTILFIYLFYNSQIRPLFEKNETFLRQPVRAADKSDTKKSSAEFVPLRGREPTVYPSKIFLPHSFQDIIVFSDCELCRPSNRIFLVHHWTCLRKMIRSYHGSTLTFRGNTLRNAHCHGGKDDGTFPARRYAAWPFDGQTDPVCSAYCL